MSDDFGAFLPVERVDHHELEAAAWHARHIADSNEVLSCVRCRHIPKEKLRT